MYIKTKDFHQENYENFESIDHCTYILTDDRLVFALDSSIGESLYTN